MATKVRKKIKAPIGLDHEMLPFAGPYYHYATMMEDGPTTRWGTDAGLTDVMFEKRKKSKVKKRG